MKKTEMVKLMSPVYVKHLEEHGCIVIDVLMDDILKVQIEAGMLPPDNWYIDNRFNNEWGDEDE